MCKIKLLCMPDKTPYDRHTNDVGTKSVILYYMLLSAYASIHDNRYVANGPFCTQSANYDPLPNKH